MSESQADIKSLSHGELLLWLEKESVATYRAGQILRWIYQRGVDGFDRMTDLSKDLRALLSRHFVSRRLVLRKVERAADGSRKYLFAMDDGCLVESVLIPERDHFTLCVSSQVGCAQGCAFCCTGRRGFVRNCRCVEIVSQARDVMHEIGSDSGLLTNVVFMGMGEPLANYHHVIAAMEILTNNDWGLRFSSRRVTVSTVGLVPQMTRLGLDTRVNLAVSLNATDNVTRSLLMPVNRTYPIETLLEACARYPLRGKRRITFEYVLLAGVNDTPEDARRLSRLLRGIPTKINLIPFNPYPDSPFRRPSGEAILAFQQILIGSHYTAVVRWSKGEDIWAACGQLGRAEP